MHLPINHRFRPIYRFLAGVAGAYLFVFGVVGLIRTWGDPLFSRDDVKALGLRTNLAFALLSIIVGAVIGVGAIIGKNVDHYINTAGGVVFLLAGLMMLMLMQTEVNILNFEVATCVVSFIIGTALMVAGLYGKTGTASEQEAEERFRHTTRSSVLPVRKGRTQPTR